MEEAVVITKQQMHDILYHLDGFLRVMGFGREFTKIVSLVESLPLNGVDISEFYQIKRIVNNKKDKSFK